ncbi:hypothetical protein [Microbulbifer epialgicus]|uniref:Uncharacterized protein n=1 Tax=Microbulbifer epialgicus TaxID=393907 RepID=A0ABV4NUQ5_9GAMM
MKARLGLWMAIKKYLEAGLEWISGKSRITVVFNGNFIIIRVYPDYPSDQHEVSLFLKIYEHEKSVKVVDLVGNGYGSGLQEGGYGALIFNLGLQAIYSFFEVKYGSDEATSIRVHGYLSSVGDPINEPEKSQCKERRKGFWSGFGFELKELSKSTIQMTACLKELKLRRGTPTINGTPRVINLDNFWPQEKRPSILSEDIDALKEIDLTKFSLTSCPKEVDVESAWRGLLKWSKVVRYTIWLGFCTLIGYLSFLTPNTIDSLIFLACGTFCGYLVAVYLENRLWRYLPSYKRHQVLQDKRCKKIAEVKESIQYLERSNNGFLWRLKVAIPPEERNRFDVFEEMINASNKQYFSSVSEYYVEYEYYLSKAQKNVNSDERRLEKI